MFRPSSHLAGRSLCRFFSASAFNKAATLQTLQQQEFHSRKPELCQLSVKKLHCCVKYLPVFQNDPTFLLSKRFFADKMPSESFLEHQVVPDVITCAPKHSISINYPCNVEVKQGNILTPTQVKDEPVLQWTADAKKLYTVAMIDPDAPSRKDPTYREWMHWLVGNVPGQNICKGDVLSAYVGSGPPPDTGLHRYVFLIYEQTCRIEFCESRLPNNCAKGRECFKIADFAKKYNLGNPIAGNFYQAEYDDYVPKLYEQLSGK